MIIFDFLMRTEFGIHYIRPVIVIFCRNYKPKSKDINAMFARGFLITMKKVAEVFHSSKNPILS